MKKTKILFAIWGVIVIVVIALLTILGFKIKGHNAGYEALEEKLLASAKQYVDINFLYPEGKEILKVQSKDLIKEKFLDELKYNNDTCSGYVVISNNSFYEYKTYIKCRNYTTKGY